MTITLRSSALFLLVCSCGACGSSVDRPEPVPDESGATANTPPSVRPAAELPPTGDDVASGACELGTSRDCRVWLPEVGGIKNCLVGTQVCITGEWSNCVNDEDAAEMLSQN